MLICKNLNPKLSINTVADWYNHCPPAGRQKQWKDGRSAKELAKDWIKTHGANLINVLNQSSTFKNVVFDLVSPEYNSKFDNFRGNSRQHDLLVIGKDGKNDFLISIEAKADESFGATIKDHYLKAVTNKINGSKTKIPERIENLINNIFCRDNNIDVFNLRYQLLYSIAGTLSEAKKQGISKCVLVIQYYCSTNTNIFNPLKHKKNNSDLNMFIEYLSKGQITNMVDNDLYGPFKFDDSDYISSATELYILKTK